MLRAKVRLQKGQKTANKPSQEQARNASPGRQRPTETPQPGSRPADRATIRNDTPDASKPDALTAQQASVTRQRQQRQHRAQTSLHAQHAQEQAYPGRGKAHQQEQAQGTAASEENGCGSKGYTQRIKMVLYTLRHKEYTRLHVKIFIKS